MSNSDSDSARRLESGQLGAAGDARVLIVTPSLGERGELMAEMIDSKVAQ